MGGIHYVLLNFFLNMECEVQITFKLYSYMINQQQIRSDVIESGQSSYCRPMASTQLFWDRRRSGLEPRTPFHGEPLRPLSSA